MAPGHMLSLPTSQRKNDLRDICSMLSCIPEEAIGRRIGGGAGREGGHRFHCPMKMVCRRVVLCADLKKPSGVMSEEALADMEAAVAGVGAENFSRQFLRLTRKTLS